MSCPRVLLLSAYDAISHRLWASHCLAIFPDAQWTIVQGKARHFAWALRGRPLQWLLDPETRDKLQAPYDLVIATSTVDLAGLYACVPSLVGTPSILYMHENQFVYPGNASTDPVRAQAHRVDACMVQIYAVLAAQRVVFNSVYHRQSMASGVQTFLQRMPVKMDASLLLDKIKSSPVLSVPIDDEAFGSPRSLAPDEPLTIVWNHRWEFDKAPDRFVLALDKLAAAGLDFRLILLGEAFGRRHPAYEALLARHADKVLHQGMVPDREGYYAQLGQGHVVVSTALHDFQGLSMLEGAARGLWPLAPRRLAYRDIYPASYLYDGSPEDQDQEASALCQALLDLEARRRRGDWDPQRFVDAARPFARASLASQYRDLFEQALGALDPGPGAS